MSEVKLNGFMNGVSGRFGNAVMRQCGDRVIIANRPQKKREPTAAMLQHQEVFREAVAYSRVSLKDPVAKAVYAAWANGKQFNSAFSTAVKDYLSAPVIVALDVSGYAGKTGNSIVVLVPDEFKIVSVDVEIRNASDVVLETGAASYQAGSLRWTYDAQTSNAVLVGTKITVTAKDRPGKIGTTVQVL